MKNQSWESRRLRVAVLTNVVLAYRTPVFKVLAEDSEFDLRMFVSLPVEESDASARQALTLRYSKGLNLRCRTFHAQASTESVEWFYIPVMLFFDSYYFQPDVVISGEFGLRSIVAYIVARMRRVPLIIWSEEIQEHAAGVSSLQRRLRSFLIPRADGFLAWGNPAVRYLQSWQVPNERIYYCAQAVDNEFWQFHSQKVDKEALRKELGMYGRVFLAVGRLVKRKGFDKLISAWSSMPEELRRGNSLIIVGGGPEESALKEKARSLGLTNITFVGMQGPEQLARYYAMADIFVFPSLLDVWGLVVNEAMACGLPILASKYAGASQELIEDTATGELYDPNNLDEFAAVLQRWCTRPKLIDPEHIRAVVKKFNFNVSVAAIRQMIAEHCNRSRLSNI